jgi:type IV secretory pathway VirB2 component (pilin)
VSSSNLRIAALLASGLLLLAATLMARAPAKLPSAALGAVWLLHLERIVAGALAISVVAAIGVRLARGELPLKLGAGSVEFETLKLHAADSVEGIEIELDALRRRVHDLDGKG